jgi:hypothetical protein
MASGLSQGGALKASRSYTYPYRSGLGIIPTAEHSVFFDDFTGLVTSNLPVGWSLAVIDAGATTVQLTTAITGGQSGVLLMSDATVSEGASINMPKNFVFNTGKKWFMEMRFQTSDVTDNTIQFGLSDLTAVTNPEDLWTTVAASLITFGILDGSATVTMLADKSNTGSTAETGTRALVVNTWHTLGIFYDGAKLFGYVDGKLALSWAQAATTVPDGIVLAPFIGVLNGNGAGAATNFVDYIRLVAER